MKTKLAAVIKKSDASLSLIASNLLAGKYQTKADLARIRASVGNAMKNSEKAFDELMQPIQNAGRKGLAEIANDEFDQACSDVAQAQIKAHILATILDKELEDAEVSEPTEDIVEVDEEGNPVSATADAEEDDKTDKEPAVNTAPDVVDEPVTDEVPEVVDELKGNPAVINVVEEPAEDKEKEDEDLTADLDLDDVTDPDETDDVSDAVDEFFDLGDDAVADDDDVEEEPAAEAKLKAVKTAKRKSTVAVSQDKAPLEGLFNFLA
nr:MAG TPA: hypothetical protein [Bacteriophage sp.]